MIIELLVAVGLLLLLDAAALQWRHDSRDAARGILGAGGLLPRNRTRAAV